MARLKQVFSSNSQLTHVWAQQKQDTGRGNNMFFEGTRIWSYGMHFLAAQIHTLKNGSKVCLTNSHRYSTSTGRHLNYISSAVRGLMPEFHVKDVSNIRGASKELDKRARDRVFSPLKRCKVSSVSDIRYETDGILECFNNANKFRELLGLKDIVPNKRDMDKVYKHLHKRLDRFRELNTPEMIQKRDANKAKRDLKNAEIEQAKLAETIDKFRKGESNCQALYRLPFELIRVQGDTVQTSRGASVPLVDAIRLFKAVQSGVLIPEAMASVGEFTFQGITDYPDGTKVLTIGCHRILWAEACNVLADIANSRAA